MLAVAQRQVGKRTQVAGTFAEPLLRVVHGLVGAHRLLVLVGDEDEWCVDASIYLKRTVPTAGLCVIPRSGHTITSEEPAKFNAAVAAGSPTGVWRMSGHPAIQQALRNHYFDSIGLPRVAVSCNA